MSIKIAGKFKINKVMNKGKYSLVALSSYEKITYGDVERHDWSNWFGKFVGDAHKQLPGIEEGAWIVIRDPDSSGKPNARLSNVKKGDGENRNNPFFVVFDFELAPAKEVESRPKSDEKTPFDY